MQSLDHQHESRCRCILVMFPILFSLLVLAIFDFSHGTTTAQAWSQPGDEIELPSGDWIDSASEVELTGNHLCAKLRRDDGFWGDRSCHFVQPGHTFVNMDGVLTLENITDWPGGTWIHTARNIRREGNLMFTELRRDDLTWNSFFTVVEDGYYFKNVNGELRRMNAGCKSLGSCLHGYTLKADAFYIYCANLVCDKTVDLVTCCDDAEPCSNVTWCVLPQIADPDEYCDGTECVESRDYDRCCVGRATCDSFDCGYGYTHRSNADSIECASTACAESELDLCCEEAAFCSTLIDQSCPKGRYFNPMEFCTGTSCDEGLDRLICCPVAAPCEDLTCPLGRTPSANMSDVYCEGASCIVARDAERCCEEAMPCHNISANCVFGYATNDDTYCDGTECDLARDLDRCCLPAEPCTGLELTNCLVGRFFNFTDYCNGRACEEVRDRDVCCQVAESCRYYDCPYGSLTRPNPLVWVDIEAEAGEPNRTQVDSLYCEGRSCDVTRDLEVCCEVQASCTTFTCPQGYVLTWNASVSLCLGEECLEERDLDICCDEQARCDENYTCPHGYVEKAPIVHCDNTVCDVEGDLNHCCDAAMPCTNLTCPDNYVHRPDTYCSLAAYKTNACTLETDKDMCCTRGMALLYYRFKIWSTKSSDEYMTQLSELNLYFFNDYVVGSKTTTGGTAWSLNGNYPGKESPIQAIDEDVETKWLDEDPDPRKNRRGEAYAFMALTVQLPTSAPMDEYSFHTANDVPERDPIAWDFWGSPDNVTWVLLDSQEDATADVPDERETETNRFPVDIPCYLPLPIHIRYSNDTTPCLEGDIIANGENCTASCREGYLPEPDYITCVQGELIPGTFACNAV